MNYTKIAQGISFVVLGTLAIQIILMFGDIALETETTANGGGLSQNAKKFLAAFNEVGATRNIITSSTLALATFLFIALVIEQACEAVLSFFTLAGWLHPDPKEKVAAKQMDTQEGELITSKRKLVSRLICFGFGLVAAGLGFLILSMSFAAQFEGHLWPQWLMLDILLSALLLAQGSKGVHEIMKNTPFSNGGSN